MNEWNDAVARQRERNAAIEAAAAESRRTTQAMLQELRGLRAGLAEERRRHEEERAASDEERAKRLRSGEQGADMQAVQRRIDAGQTTWRAVWSGQDDHASAVRVRKLAEENLGRLRVQVETERPDESEAAAARDEALRQAQFNRGALADDGE